MRYSRATPRSAHRHERIRDEALTHDDRLVCNDRRPPGRRTRRPDDGPIGRNRAGCGDRLAPASRSLERALWRARQRDLDRYPAQSVDAADLEERLRRIDRSMLGRFY